FFQAEDGIRDGHVTGVQTCALPISTILFKASWRERGETVNLDLVARVAPSTPAIFDDTDLGREFELLQALADSPVHIPTPRWFRSEERRVGKECRSRVSADD